MPDGVEKMPPFLESNSKSRYVKFNLAAVHEFSMKG